MRVVIRAGVIFVVLLLLFSVATIFRAYALTNDPCPGQGHVATPDEISAGFISGQKVCPKDETELTPESGEAKQYLQSILRGGRCGPYQTTAQQLDAKFAVCAARFLKDARAKDGNIRIESMYRSAPHQAYLCGGGCGIVNGPCARPGQSKHQSGIAIDISNGQHILPSWIQAMARGYGLQFPVPNDSGHMEPIASSNCSDPNFKPTDTVGDLTPGTTVADQIRRALGMQQQPSMPPQPQLPPQPMLPAQPILSNQPTASSLLNMQPTTSLQSPQMISVSDLINSNANTSSSTNKNTKSTSTFDLIDAYLNPVSDSIDIGKAVDIALNPDTSDATSLDGRRPTSTLNASGTLTIYQTLSVPQTFTSNDLANNPISSYVVGQNTFLLRLLEIMKNALLFALNYLKPFGGYAPSQLVAE